MKAVFLIINYNDASTTIGLLKKIQSFQSIDVCVVLDNCSTDSSFLQLQEYENNHTHILQAPSNLGYGGGINYAVKYIVNNYGNSKVIVSNSDILIEGDEVIQKIVKDLDMDSLGIIAPVILEQAVKKYGWRHCNIWYESLCNLPFISRWFRKKLYYKEIDMKEEINPVDIMSGCFFAMRTAILEEVGYFDENIFLYYEENVISKKLEKYHYFIAVDTSIQVVHNHSVSIDKSYSSYNKLKEMKKSQYYMYSTYMKNSILSRWVLKASANLALLSARIRR